MNMPSERGITNVLEVLPREGETALQTHGRPALSFESRYLAMRFKKEDFSARPSSLPRCKKSPCEDAQWEVLPAAASEYVADLNGEIKSTAVNINDLIPWVRIIAQKIHRPLPSNVMLNDLIQDGMIGLIAAFREHDATLGVPFHAFAENKIKWTIMDGLRAGDWAGRSVRRRANQVTKASEKLQSLLHREPSKREIADELGVRVDDVTGILGDAYGYSFVRINDGLNGEAQDIPDSRMEPFPIVERREAYSRAVAGMRMLKPTERKAVILRIMCDMSVLQIAAEMGVSESRVSQLYKSATRKLADYVTHSKPQSQ